MLRKACAALSQKLSSVVSLSKSRVETLSLLIIGMASARTVNLTHIASERPSDVKVASSYRRLQRFFQHVRPGQDWTANVVIGLLGIKGRLGAVPGPDQLESRQPRRQYPAAGSGDPTPSRASAVDGSGQGRHQRHGGTDSPDAPVSGDLRRLQHQIFAR